MLGKYDDKINKIKRSQPSRSVDAVLQELEAKGAEVKFLPSTSYAEEDIEEHMEPSRRESTSDSSDSSKYADSTSDEEVNAALDAVIKQTIQRQRRDSGLESDEDKQLGKHYF